MDDLNRRMAPFGEEIWQRIDNAAVNAARDLLTGRRFLEVDGPYGVGLTSVEVGHDDFCRQPTPQEAGAVMGRAISVPMLRKDLRLSIRRPVSTVERSTMTLIPMNVKAPQTGSNTARVSATKSGRA